MPSVSEKQRRFMATVMAYKEGKIKKVSPEIKKAAEGMTKKQIDDFVKKVKKGK